MSGILPAHIESTSQDSLTRPTLSSRRILSLTLESTSPPRCSGRKHANFIPTEISCLVACDQPVALVLKTVSFTTLLPGVVSLQAPVISRPDDAANANSPGADGPSSITSTAAARSSANHFRAVAPAMASTYVRASLRASYVLYVCAGVHTCAIERSGRSGVAGDRIVLIPTGAPDVCMISPTRRRATDASGAPRVIAATVSRRAAPDHPHHNQALASRRAHTRGPGWACCSTAVL